MSILIKGMDMPKNCWSCRLETIINCEPLMGNESASKYKDKRHKNCPLIELPPHGRLIDAGDLSMMHFTHCKHEGDTMYVSFCEVAKNIFDAPTIIEAEETNK